MKKGRNAFLIILGITFLFLCGGCIQDFVSQRPSDPVEIKFGLIEKELKPLDLLKRKDFRITIGRFQDRTGQRKDSDQVRYSSAVTQGVTEIMYHLLYEAFGPRALVERERENVDMIQKEYTLSHQVDNKGRRNGLIQRGGPDGGLYGAGLMVTGAVVYYHVDRSSGGGGINVEGVGANVQFSHARVGIQLRLVDINSSEIIWSTMVESGVTGYVVGFDLFRFITTAGSEFLVNAEAGLAEQLPADYAMQLCLEDGVVAMVKENVDLFYEQQPAVPAKS